MLIMGKGKRIVFKLLIVLISFFCINGGRSLMLISNNEQILFTYDLVNDIEIPHQQHFGNFTDEEKWLESFKFDFSSIHLKTVKDLLTLNSSPQEFSDSIWQPPKSV
jgi:hypothetical protein